MSVAVAEQFQSLYRRYRPQCFSEIRGQGHVVLGLRNAVRDERVAHAYLFSGPRGTGKTSTARILAKALNCASPADGEPCGVCDSCVDIVRGASLDVHELDAASNNGVEAMRDLVARASLATPGKWKVYIVDEVHMLSTAAANALLKTLEEPPSHVVFVLATTDPQKVLPTIKSRTQHFEFHLLEPDVLEGLLSDIARDAALDIPADGIDAAVRRGHGSARDALSALDQVAAAGVVEQDDRYVGDLIRAIAEQDTVLGLRTVGEAMVAGFDAARLAAELVDGLREVFLGVVAPGLPRTVTRSADQAGGPLLGPARSVRALEVIGTAIVDMREALDARTTLEVALVRLTHAEVDDGPGALLDRLERLERRMAELSAGATGLSPAPVPNAAPAPAARTDDPGAAPPKGSIGGSAPALGAFRSQPTPSSVRKDAPPGPEATSELATEPSPRPAAATTQPKPPPDRDDLVAAWGDHILGRLRARPKAVYAAGRFVACDDGLAVFALPNAAHVVHAEPLINEVAEALSSYFGTPMRLKLVTDTSSDPMTLPMTDGAPDAGRKSVTPNARVTPSRPAAKTAPQATPEMEEPDYADLEAGEAAGPVDSVSWAETRLLEAFPGAEEVPDDRR